MHIFKKKGRPLAATCQKTEAFLLFFSFKKKETRVQPRGCTFFKKNFKKIVQPRGYTIIYLSRPAHVLSPRVKEVQPPGYWQDPTQFPLWNPSRILCVSDTWRMPGTNDLFTLFLNKFLKIYFRLLPKIRQSLPCILTKHKVFHLSNSLKNPTSSLCSTRSQSISIQIYRIYKRVTMNSYTLVVGRKLGWWPEWFPSFFYGLGGAKH